MKKFKLKITKEILVLLLILLLALALRMWGIGFGLPYTYHVDEPPYISGALNLGAGMVGRQPNPTGLINLLFGEYGIFYIVGRGLRLFHSLGEFEGYYRTDPTLFYLLGRLTSALLGGLTVLAAYGLGSRIANRRVGWTAAIFLAVAFLHVRDSHFSVPDAPVTFFAAISVLASLHAMHKKSTAYLLLAAGLAGVTLALKWTLWMVVLPVALASYQIVPQDQKRSKLWSWLRLVVLAAAVFLLVFSLFSFEFFLNPKAYLDYMLHELRLGAQGGFSIWQVDRVSGWLFYLKTLSYGVGWLSLGLGGAGLLALGYQAIRKRDARLVVFLAFPLIYYLVMGSTRHYFARYALPLLPFWLTGAAWLAVEIADRLGRKLSRPSGIFLAGIALLAALQPLIYSVRFDQILMATDTRTLAKQWIEEHLPEGARIGVDWRAHTPPLASPDNDFPIPNSKRTYQVIEPAYEGLFRDEGVAFYRQAGYDYLIASSFIYEIPLLDSARQQQRQQFYADLGQAYPLIKTFYPNDQQFEPDFIFDEMYGPVISLWQRQRAGPVLKIYAVNATEQP